MSEIPSNSATSKNEIKIEMKFWEAVEITQETYNNYQENADNDLNNLNLQELPTPEKWRFKLKNKFYDKNSNFSGMTYIYEEENAVNVAIACRGSSKNWKDWVQNLLIIPFCPNTCADNKAKQYAIDILNKIKNDDKYKDKKINIITLGHSKGGREAQKQMLALLDIYKKDDNKVNICCLTFNSAPVFPIIPIRPLCLSIIIVLSLLYFGFRDTFLLFLAVSLCSILYFNKKEKKHSNNCLNLAMSDSAGLLYDILALVSSRRYGKQHGYANHNKEIVPSVSIVGSYLICYILDILYEFGHFHFLENLTDPEGLKQLLNLPLFIIFVVFIAIYVIWKLHSVNSFKDKSSYFEDLNGAKISDILGMKDEDNLTKLAQKRLWKQYKPEVRDIIEKNNKDYIEKKSFLCKSKNREASDSILLNIIPNETIGEIIHISEKEIIQKGTEGMIRVHKKEFFKDGESLNQIKKGDRRVIKHYFNKKTNKIEYTHRHPFLYFF